MAVVDVADAIVNNRIISRDDHPVYTTIQAADDALDGGPYFMWVKEGTYDGFTISTDKVRIFLEQGVVITGAVTLSGDNAALIRGPGVTIQGLITVSGDGSYMQSMNGGGDVGVLISGDRCYMNGGGWGTVCDGGITRRGIDLEGDDGIVENIAAQTTGGGGVDWDAVFVDGVRPVLANVKIPDSDLNGIRTGAPCTDALILGCISIQVDAGVVNVQTPRTRLIGHRGESPGAFDGIFLAATSDNSVVGASIIQVDTGDSVEINAGGDNSVVCGNRLDGAIDDNAAGTVAAINDTTAF